MSLRPPQGPDRLSSLSSLGDSSERRSPGHQRQPSDASEGTGLVQRCVVVQRDQNGFGFTVSGDRVVLVQSVRPGGAAMRAGVQEGDRIVKVNGTMVTNSSHLEVVKLIKSGAYVALTLLGSPPPSAALSSSQPDGSSAPGGPRTTSCCPPPPPPLPPPQRITEPRPLQDPEVQKHAAQILRRMLRQEEAELQRFYEAYSRQPGSEVEEQIEGARRRLSQLQLKILQETGSCLDSGRLCSDSSLGSVRAVPGRLSLDSQDGDSGLESGPERLPSASEVSLTHPVPSERALDSPRTSPVPSSRLCQHRRQGSDPPEQGTERAGGALIIGPEEDWDPGDCSSEGDFLFQDLAKLKSRPAHLGVFLRYICSQADPSPLLFYLCSDVCQQSSPRDCRALARDILSIFLDRNAPLRVKVSEQLLAEIESCLRNGDDVRAALLDAQELVMPEIQEQIQDYRTKRTMGLGSLYGENDLLELDGDPQRERQVAEKQLAQLGDILSKYEEDRSSPMAFALSTYMSHIGIRCRELRPPGASDKCQALPDRDKWLPFFPKPKKSSSSRKEKEALEDKKRNPILKYIGKPKASSQSTFHVPLSPVEVRPGSVRNIIQHFESSQQQEGQEQGSQRRASGGTEELLPDSCRAEVRLGRSESLKGREELKRSRKAENVPRSRSDVDMDAAAEAARLHQSASSSASSLSTRSLENPTPPYTPKLGRRSIESPNLGFGLDPFLPHLLEDEQGQASDLEPELDWQSWQQVVSRELVANLPQKEIDRQEVINELFATEASHLRTLRVLDLLFYQRMRRENLLSREELALLFPNLPDLIDIHNSLSESMRKLREEGPIIKEIGDLMLSRFDGLAKEEIQQVAADFCSCQSIALELIKTKQRKESRFQLFMQEAESHPQCRRLQLKDLIVSEMQRLTKYPLLLESIIRHTEVGSSEQEKLCRARDQCRAILKHVNEAVKRAENRQRLEGYQKRLDATSLERTSNPLAAEFKNLDLTSRCMIHEGALSWRVSKDKTVDLHVLLLEDLLVLLQKQDEKLVLKCHSKTALGSSDTKQSFSPVLKLTSVLIRSVATDKRALFIICTSELGPQIYELVAQTSSERSTWMELLEEAVQSASRSASRSASSSASSSASFAPPRRAPEPARLAPPGLALPDPEVCPLLPAAPSSGAEAEDCSSDDNANPLLPAGGAQALLEEEPGSSEVEEGDEELPRAPLPTGLQLEVGTAQHPGPPPRLPLPGPAGTEGLAEAALEDVESLRLLLLRRLLPGRELEPEDDATPTASMPGGAPRGWHSTLSTPQQLLAEPSCQGAKGREEGTQQGGAAPEDPNGYRVVRKAQGKEGAEEATPSPGSSQSETELQEGGGANVDGNYFYISTASGPSQPPAAAPSPPGGALQDAPPHLSPPTAAGDPPGPPPRDVDLIFLTMEQLSLKLHRLKALEGAHRALLSSLGRSPPPADVSSSPPGGGRRPQRGPPRSSPPRGLALQEAGTNAPGSRAPLAEDPPPDSCL